MSEDVTEQLPAINEGDTIVLDRRQKYADRTDEWCRQETTVKSVREDGVTVEYSEPNKGYSDLQLLLDYGDARIAQETQRTLVQFSTDGGGA